MSELYLYHATDRKNLESILKYGLLINPPEHAYAEEIGTEALCGKIFLAFDSDVAESYAEEADECPEDIVILKVKVDCLNQNNFRYDWNNRCEYYEDINSCVYTADIPGSLLQECNSTNEPFQNIHTFKGTDMYEIIMNTFDEECETNLEHEDEDEE